ncbi:MAG: co-chaperone GroES [Bacteroidia bacterium]|nr:co-chaperone GroES [Bacteroidia bacterium]
MELPVKEISKIIIVGDRILIKPLSATDRTKSGLYLPPTVAEEEVIQSGYIVNVGPGYPIPSADEETDFWKEKKEKAKYIPLQANVGDLAVYLRKYAYEVIFNEEKYFIIPNSAVLMLYRDEF